ncbi:Gfo/Idh/MocA family protein [Psychroserpens sp.]|uniref:Gfo/Idh/MocA family protein n=1 Tax=Psychroserpens sp. TaxID=2020870 RepID=UPI00385CB3B6
MTKIRIGILGSSNIAKKAIIPTLVSLDHIFEIVGIASRDISKIKDLTKTLNVEAFQGYDAILDKTFVDAIYIPLPNALHFEFVEKALKNGIHVLVEKSLGCNLSEVTKLVSLARNNRLVLMENFQFRFHSQLKFLIDKLKSKEIGDIRAIKASFGFPPFSDLDNIRYKKELGGGALLDAGAYTAKISQIILGFGLSVEAASLNKTPKDEVDIWGGAFLKQKENGLFSSLAFGFNNYYQCGVEIWCSEGKISTNRLFTAPPGYKPLFEIETPQDKQTIELQSDNHFVNMLTHFYDCIYDEELKEMENQQNLDQARIIEGIKNKAYE